MPPSFTGVFSLLAVSMIASSAAASDHPPALDISAGRLIDAITAIGRQSGVSIATTVTGIAGIRTPPVRGTMPVDVALTRLLSGTGLVAIRAGPRTFRIERLSRPDRPLPERPALPEPPAPDILVTAGKQRNPLDLYPGSAQVVMFDGPRLRHAGGRGTQALLDELPVLATTSLGPGREKLFLRGIADSSFAGASQATVGQYLGEVQLNYNAPDPDLSLYDIERVEILQGPQGTLYGAGSLGGVVRLLPRPPVLGRWEGNMQAAVGATWHGGMGADLAGVVNAPLGPDAGLRLLAYGGRMPGYIDDLRRGLHDVNTTQTLGGRGSIRVVPGNGWTVDFGGTFQSIRNRDAQYVELTGPPLTRAVAIAEPSTNRFGMGQITVRKLWDDGKELVTSFAAVQNRLTARYDANALTGGRTDAADSRNDASLVTAEARLSRLMPDGTGWVLGAHVISSDDQLVYHVDGAAAPVFLRGVRNHVFDTAIFGQATAAIAPHVQLTLGGRLSAIQLNGFEILATGYEKDIGFAANDHETIAFAPSLAVTWQAGPGVVGYARYQRGYRVGGYAVEPFDDLGVGVGDGVGDGRMGVVGFRPDTLDMVEAGLRFGATGKGVSGRITLSTARWRNIQADITGPGGPYTSNVGDGRVHGLEINANWMMTRPGLNLSAGLFLADSGLDPQMVEMESIEARRQALPNIPTITGRLSADHRIPFASGASLTLGAGLRYVSRSWLGVGPLLQIPQGDFVDASALAEYRIGRHSLFVDVRNLLDTKGNRFSVGNPLQAGNADQRTPLQPRTVKVGFTTRF